MPPSILLADITEEELELEKLDDDEEEAKEDLDRPELMSMVPIPDIILLIMPSMSKLHSVIPPIPPIPPIDIIPPGIGPPDDIIVDDDEEDDVDLKLEVVDPSGD